MRKLLPVAAVLLILGVCSDALAGVPPAVRVEMSRALKYSHGAPCPVHLTVGPETQAIRAIEESYGQTVAPMSWATPATCSITLNSTYWNATTEAVRGELLCVALVHEIGNLRGIPETDELTPTRNVRDYWLEEIIPPRACR